MSSFDSSHTRACTFVPQAFRSIAEQLGIRVIESRLAACLIVQITVVHAVLSIEMHDPEMAKVDSLVRTVS